MLTRTEMVERRITKLIVKWEPDDVNNPIDWLDCLATHDKKSGNVNVQETYENIIKEGGSTPGQSRLQTAQYLAQYEAYRNNLWNYVGCVVSAIEETTNEREVTETKNLVCASLWGFESFIYEETRKETEENLISESLQELRNLGYSIPSMGLHGIPIEREDFYPDRNPADYVSPLQELPVDDKSFTYRYGSKGETLDYSYDGEKNIGGQEDILATCKFCDWLMEESEKHNSERHWEDCPLFVGFGDE